MLGRITYENPWILSDVDRIFYKQKNLGYSRREIIEVKKTYLMFLFMKDIYRICSENDG